MGTIAILAVWIAAVATVQAVVTRPWKIPAARSPFAVVPAVAMTAWVLGTGILAYKASMADSAWTAASVTLGFIPLKAILLSLMAHGAGRAVLKARGTRDWPAWGVAGVLAVLCIYSVGADVAARNAAALEKHAADETLPPGEVLALADKLRANAAGDSEAWAFLGNRLCPPDLLAEAAASPDPRRRTAAARNSTLSRADADRLIGDVDEQVRFYLAFNTGLTPEHLSRLAKDKSVHVRGIVARREQLPDDAFAALVDDPAAEVRSVVALQSRISSGAIEKLRNDPQERVRNAANRWAK